MTRNSWIALLVGLALACACACVGAGAVGTFVFVNNSVSNRAARPTSVARPVSTSTPRPTLAPAATPAPRSTPATSATPSSNATPSSRATPSPAATPPAAPTPASDGAANRTLDALWAAQAQLPPEDPVDLAVRFKGVSPERAAVVCSAQAPGYEIGATRPFTLTNQDDNSQFGITAELRYKTANVYMWVQSAPNRLRLDDARLRRAADTFQQKIYPTTRAFFGEEANPGVDCDPRLYILHAAGIGRTVGGYFSSPDGYPRSVRGDSNEAEMFVIHADRGYSGATPATNDYLSTLAHEFQHMVSHNTTRAPSLWLEEGAAQLSERLSGYAEGVGTMYDFARNPDTQLNTWSESSAGENSAHYGAGYLFWSYLYDRFGEPFTRQFARSPERSIPALVKLMADAGLANPDTGKPPTFEEVFADFVIANYQGRNKMSDDGGAPNRFNYASIDVPTFSLHQRVSAAGYPVDRSETLSQFGTHYWELKGNRPVVLEFAGAQTVSLLPLDGQTGKFWYSNRADVSNMRLTREFDLTNARAPKINFRAWYRIERDYDYAYLTASADGGKTWATVKTSSCTTDNPQNANLGCGYTGASGGDREQPRWVNESADLSAYAGKKVLLRFEIVSDAGVNREGIAIDNIEIPDIGYKDDAEANNGWTAEGWVLADNTLPQNWQVQLILESNNGATVARRVLLTDGQGTAQVNFGRGSEDIRTAIVVVSPTTLVTTEPGNYQLKLR